MIALDYRGVVVATGPGEVGSEREGPTMWQTEMRWEIRFWKVHWKLYGLTANYPPPNPQRKPNLRRKKKKENKRKGIINTPDFS